MNITVLVGDVLEQPADVLICPANPWLNLSGGVSGALLAQAGESLQRELHAFLSSAGRKSMAPGAVVRSTAGPLPFRHILHVVAIDPFYDSSVELVASALHSAFDAACGLGARCLAMPMLATGYGRLPVDQFASAFRQVTGQSWTLLEDVKLVVRTEELADLIRGRIGGAK